MFMFKYACFFSFICLFLVACGDGGTSEPILYPEQPLVKSSSSDAPESSDSFSSSGNVSSSSSSVESSSSEDKCISGECFFTDERDGQVYRAVRIGNQVWMAQNLNYDVSGKPPQICTGEKCLGRTYLWNEAMDSDGIFSANGKNCGFGSLCSPAQPTRGICPEGWHLPSKADWDTLRMVASGSESIELPFGASERAGNALRSKTGWKDDKNGTDEFKFTVYPNASGSEVTFFLSSEYSEQTAALGTITYERASGGGGVKDLARYIRCIRGESSKDSSGAAQNSIAKSSSSVSVNSSSSEIKSSSSCDTYISYGEMTDERDDHVYRTMTIDGCTTKKDASGEYSVKVPRQTWMAENLNYAYLQPTSTLDSSSWCYNNEPDSCVKYGRLYLWSAAMDSAALFSEDAKGCGFYRNAESWQKCHITGMGRGVCPEGWHLPTRQEYGNLQSTTPLVCKMKNDAQVTNGFLLQFGGLYYAEPDCCTVYNYTNGEHFFEWGEDASFFWFASEGTIGSDAYRVMVEEVSCVPSTVSTYKFFAFSVRCVKDVPGVE
ncbi:MAG: hypothetical protein J6P30_03865 [Fibrobacter sp.]|nr:hypothetical protein [Fibrobacter sp.]